MNVKHVWNILSDDNTRTVYISQVNTKVGDIHCRWRGRGPDTDLRAHASARQLTCLARLHQSSAGTVVHLTQSNTN